MRKRQFKLLTIFMAVSLPLGFIAQSTQKTEAAVPGNNTLISVNNSGDGQGGNGHTGNGTYSGDLISRNGKVTAFHSLASNLVSSDTNGYRDVFSRDLSTNTTTRISVSSSGVQSNNESYVQAISETGRYVVFRSKGTNLIDGQSTSGEKFFIRDTVAGTTSLSLINSNGNAVGGSEYYVKAISNDGRFLLLEHFGSKQHIYVVDSSSNEWDMIDVPSSGSQQSVDSKDASMSCDGAFVVFSSAASNLVSGDTNGKNDIFLFDRRNGDKLTSITGAGNDDSVSATISCNGNFIGFSSKASNIVSGASTTSYGYGHYFRYDRINGGFVVIDQTTGGTISNYGAVFTDFPQLTDKGDAIFPDRSSALTGYSNPKWQLFFRNVSAGTTEILTKNSSGTMANDDVTYGATITADGKKAAFHTSATNLISSDTNGYVDMFVGETGL